MSTSPFLGFTFLEEGQAAAEVTINNAHEIIDWASSSPVEDRDENDSDNVTPNNGQAWLVAASVSAGDDWEGQEGNIAVYSNGWFFIEPVEGMRIWVKDEDAFLIYDGSSWVEIARLTRFAVVQLKNPSVGDECVLFRAPSATTLQSVRGVKKGGTSVDINIFYGSDRSAAGTQALSSDLSVTSETTGSSTSSLNNDSPASGDWVWVGVQAVSGSVDWVEVVLEFNGS